MARSRYSSTPVVAGKYAPWVDRAVDQHGAEDILADVPYDEHIFSSGERLDHLAAKYLGDDRYYWVIALVNFIPFPLDVAAGTRLRIPRDVNQVLRKLLP